MEGITICSVMIAMYITSTAGQTVMKTLQKPDNISQEMFCLGCQVTVKELDFVLRHKPTRGMGETVTRALMRVCDENNFKKYDVDYKKVLQVCKHMKGDESMEEVLISEYGRKHEQGKQFTYLEMTDMICGTVLGACNPPAFLQSGEDGGISYDPATEEFTVKEGRNVRVAGSRANVQKQQTPPQAGGTPADKPQVSTEQTKVPTPTEDMKVPIQDSNMVETSDGHLDHEEL